MKKYLGIITILFLMCSIVSADVTATIIGHTLDQNGNIIVKTQYKIDGVEVLSKYPKLNGKFYLITRHSAEQFAGMTLTEKKARIAKEIRQHTKFLVRQSFKKKQNEVINSNDMPSIIGQSVVTSTASIFVDADKDGINDTKWTVRTDGTKTETPYTPTVIAP